MAPWLSIHSPTTKWGNGGGASHQRGMHFRRPQGGCTVFAAKGGIRNGARKRRTSPAQRYYITPEGESPQPACKAKPITGRTLGAQGQRPGGAINPHARKGVSTFGNTGKHRPEPGPDSDRATGAWAAGPYMFHICSRYAPRRLPSGVTAGTSMPAIRVPSSDMAMFCRGPFV